MASGVGEKLRHRARGRAAELGEWGQQGQAQRTFLVVFHTGTQGWTQTFSVNTKDLKVKAQRMGNTTLMLTEQLQNPTSVTLCTPVPQDSSSFTAAFHWGILHLIFAINKLGV